MQAEKPMSKKAYSQQEREQIGEKLLKVSVEMLSQKGLKETKLQDILQKVGISKPFFYGSYYSSLAELVVAVLHEQRTLLLKEAEKNAQKGAKEQIQSFLSTVTFNREGRFFVMTQQEELWTYRNLSQADFEKFQQSQERFFAQLLQIWNIPPEKCSPKELLNLILSVLLIHNSAAQSLPFFFEEELEKTARTQIEALSSYLAGLIKTEQ